MWIKICANTNVEDALLAAELGADALGFVFAPSSRRVTTEQAAAISRQLPETIERVGVFDSHDAAEIVATVERAHLTGAQMHGGLDLDLVRRLTERLPPHVVLIQTLHWDVGPEVPSPDVALARQIRDVRTEPAIQRILVDSRVHGKGGGTGVAFDWQAAARVFAAELGSLKLILAGGLRPDNVADAISRLNPWGVDVATGVEALRGKKDPEKLEAFLKKASAVTTSNL